MLFSTLCFFALSQGFGSQPILLNEFIEVKLFPRKNSFINHFFYINYFKPSTYEINLLFQKSMQKCNAFHFTCIVVIFC